MFSEAYLWPMTGVPFVSGICIHIVFSHPFYLMSCSCFSEHFLICVLFTHDNNSHINNYFTINIVVLVVSL